MVLLNFGKYLSNVLFTHLVITAYCGFTFVFEPIYQLAKNRNKGFDILGIGQFLWQLCMARSYFGFPDWINVYFL